MALRPSTINSRQGSRQPLKRVRFNIDDLLTTEKELSSKDLLPAEEVKRLIVALNKIACHHRGDNNHRECLVYLSKVLEVCKKYSTVLDQLDLGKAYRNIAVCLYEIKRIKESLNYSGKAISILTDFQKRLFENSRVFQEAESETLLQEIPKLVSKENILSLHIQGSALSMMGLLSKAKQSYEQAVKEAQTNLGTNHVLYIKMSQILKSLLKSESMAVKPKLDHLDIFLMKHCKNIYEPPAQPKPVQISYPNSLGGRSCSMQAAYPSQTSFTDVRSMQAPSKGSKGVKKLPRLDRPQTASTMGHLSEKPANWPILASYGSGQPQTRTRYPTTNVKDMHSRWRPLSAHTK